MGTKNLQHKIFVHAPVEKVYRFFYEQKKHALLTDAEVELPTEIGAEFILFGGAIQGDIQELVPNSKIVWSWFCHVAGWPEGHYSRVEFNFIKKDGGTELVLQHDDIPVEAYRWVKEGWEERYWQPLKTLLG